MKKSRSSKKKWAIRISSTLKLTPEQQLAFWKELNKPVKLTAAQRQLGAIMRGEL